MRYWKIAPGRGGRSWVEQRDAKCIALGWNDTDGLDTLKSGERIEREFRRWYKKRPDQLMKFYKEVRREDKIIASSGEWIYGTGTVTSRYRFLPELTLKHAKAVNWERTFWEPVSVEDLRISRKTKKKLRGPPPRTIRELSATEWGQIETALSEIKDPFKDIGHFKGLSQAPQSEQELVILFSKLSEDRLGMRIASVGTRFPDALVRIKRHGTWKTVRAEFELWSSSFKKHGHLEQMKGLMKTGDWSRQDPCYLICWKNDMSRKPRNVKIVEVRKEAQRIA